MQAVTTVLPVSPLVSELVGQAVHATSPEAALDVPTAQAEGVPPSGPVYPGFATHAVIAVEPVAASVLELVGQAVHAALPEAALNASTGHAVGVPLSGPVYPGFATHAVIAVEPAASPVAELVGHLHVQEGE